MMNALNPFDAGVQEKLFRSKGAEIYWNNWREIQDWYHCYLLPCMTAWNSQPEAPKKKKTRRKRKKKRKRNNSTRAISAQEEPG